MKYISLPLQLTIHFGSGFGLFSCVTAIISVFSFLFSFPFLDFKDCLAIMMQSWQRQWASPQIKCFLLLEPPDCMRSTQPSSQVGSVLLLCLFCIPGTVEEGFSIMCFQENSDSWVNSGVSNGVLSPSPFSYFQDFQICILHGDALVFLL